jgi:hypothetical protein
MAIALLLLQCYPLTLPFYQWLTATVTSIPAPGL